MVATRFILFSLRGVDQSGRAFRSADNRIEKMIERQMQLAGVTRRVAKQQIADQLKAIETLQRYDDVMYRLMFAGTAFTIFASLVAAGMWKIIEGTSAGELYALDFSRAWDKLMDSIAESILEQWGPAIQGFIGWLDQLAENETFQMIIGKTAIPAVITIGVMGISLLAISIVGKFITGILSLLVATGWIAPTTAISVVAGVATLTIGLAVIFAVSLTYKLIKEEIDEKLRDIFGVEFVERPLGFEPIVVPPFPGKQLGTTMVSRTGLARVHAGEMIFNPQLPITPPPQMRGIGGGFGGPINVYVTQYVDTVSTEADEDRLAEKTAEHVADKLAGMIG